MQWDCAGLGNAAKWKSNMLEKASALFSSRGANLQSYIYGTSALANGQRTDKVRIAPLAVPYICITHLVPDAITGEGQTYLVMSLHA